MTPGTGRVDLLAAKLLPGSSAGCEVDHIPGSDGGCRPNAVERQSSRCRTGSNCSNSHDSCSALRGLGYAVHMGDASKAASPAPLSTGVCRARRRARYSALGFATVLALGSPPLVGVVGASSQPGVPYPRWTGHAATACRVPRVAEVVVAVARKRASKAGCRLRVLGASVERPTIQTIRRQSPGVGQHARVVTVWVNPLCSGSAAHGPPGGEPVVTPGPTELVSGLYLDGGPHRFWSEPRCGARGGTPGAGTITVRNAASAVVVATQSVTEGKLARIPLAPGMYAITGRFSNAIRNGQPIETRPRIVTISRGETVRQDVVESIP